MRQSKYTKEFLSEIVNNSKSLAEVLRKLNLKVTGGNYRHISSKIISLSICTKHFVRSWNKGLTKETSEKVKSITKKITTPNEEVFKENSLYTNVNGLRTKLLKLGREYRCSICELTSWRNLPITLHLDHINGNHTDNRLENLRFLCPNCHQQTETWGSKKA